jgi:hypothetical protein
VDRVARLKELLDEAGIANHDNYVYDEQAAGEAGAKVEIFTLFRAIQDEMLRRGDPHWLDNYAKNISSRQQVKTRFHEAMCAVAASNVDRNALVEVIRYYQSHITYFFLTMHDGVRVGDALTLRLAYSSGEEDETDVDEPSIGQMRLFPDELHADYENFLIDSGDDFTNRPARAPRG